MILALAWRNIWRQPIRTVLSVLGMALTTMLLVFMLCFQLASYDTMKSSVLRIADGFGQVQAEGYHDDPDIERVVADPQAVIADLRAVPGITAVAARGVGFGLMTSEGRSFAVGVTGIDPAQEPQVSTLPTLIDRGRALRAQDSDAIVIGDGLARNLRVGPGQSVTLLGSGRDGAVAADVLQVVGVFKSNVPELDRAFAQMPLGRFDETFLMEGQVHQLALMARDLPTAIRAEPALRAVAARHGAVYLNWSELHPEIVEAIAVDKLTAVTMYATLIVVVVFITLNTLYMSVLERSREFGVLMAIGMRRRKVGIMVWAEIILLAVLGNGLGLILGMAITYWVQQVGIQVEGLGEVYDSWGLPERFYPAMTPLRVLIAPGAIVAAIALLGVIPFRRVMRLRPVEAMSS